MVFTARKTLLWSQDASPLEQAATACAAHLQMQLVAVAHIFGFQTIRHLDSCARSIDLGHGEDIDKGRVHKTDRCLASFKLLLLLPLDALESDFVSSDVFRRLACQMRQTKGRRVGSGV